MKFKIPGIFWLLLVLFVFTAFASSDPWWNLSTSRFLQFSNIENLLTRISMYGILGIGVAFVIITGGIDLSIGSTVCLSGVLLAMFLHVDYQAEGELPVLEIQTEEAAFVVPRGAENWEPGRTQVRFAGGRYGNRQIYKVDAVEIVPEGTRVRVGGIVPPVREGAQAKDFGTLTPVRDVFSLNVIKEGGEAESWYTRVVLGPGLPLQERDRLMLLDLSPGASRQVTESVEAVRSDSARGDTVRLANEVRNSDVQWGAILLQRRQRMSVPVAILLTLAITGTLGLIHGLLVTRAGLQPFVVTLCGLLIYRGVSRWLTEDNPAGFNEYSESLCKVAGGDLILTGGDDPIRIPYVFFMLLTVGFVAAVLLNLTVWGRYLKALGRNEQAARFSGIHTGKATVGAYVLCTMLAGLGGMLFSLDSLSVSPGSFGNFFELYAIAAAVLGGCSLRGGEGTIAGVVIGTAVMQVLNNLINVLRLGERLEYAVIGCVILLGAVADEVLRKAAAKRRLAQQRAGDSA